MNTFSARRLSTAALIGSAFLASGCQCGAVHSAVDASAVDVSIANMIDVGPSSPSCTDRIAGNTPFAVQLSGRGEYIEDSESRASLGLQSESITVYFPEGRAPGAPFIVTHPKGWPWGGINAEREELDESSGGMFDIDGASNNQGLSISGELVGPDRGVSITSRRNFSPPDNDVARIGIASFELCLDGAIPEPVLRFHMPTSLTPISTLHLASTLQWSEPPTLRARTAEGTEIPLTTEIIDGLVLEIRAASAFPPGATIAWEIEGSDVLGRSLRIEDVIPTPALPFTAVSDLTFETEPAANSIWASNGWRWDDERSALIVGAISSPVRGANPFAFILALGEAPDGLTHVRVDQHLSCLSETRDARAAIVDASGAATPLELACSSASEPTSLHAELPGSGPLWLVMVYEPLPNRPQWSPGAAQSTWTLERIVFEP